jgi:polyribonucleotide nucleotidyltransferase
MNSEVTSSNGSSSMASVCGATLALIDAGVPIREPVAGVSVGFALQQGQDMSELGLLLDITGTEDHYGYMDFKIAGTREGVTALQLDVKKPLPLFILGPALELAREGRIVILDRMSSLCNLSSKNVLCDLRPRPTMKYSAPRVEIVRFDPLRKRDLIGPGGAVLRQLEDRFGVSLDLTQEGHCLLYGANKDMVAEAKSAVMDLVSDVVVGGVYEGTVIDLMDFGAVVELLRNKEGLLHVSEMGADLVASGKGADRSHHGSFNIVKQQLQIGQKIEVLCTDVDPVQGVIKLSRKALVLQKQNAAGQSP